MFINHHGSLNHQRGGDEAKQIEKILNDHNVKVNLQGILDKTSKHVSRLRADHNLTMDNKSALKKNNNERLNLNGSMDFNDRQSYPSSPYNNKNSSVASDYSPFSAAVANAKKCPVEHNPIREIMEEEGRNLSPSQVTREMLFNCRVMRRKDFNVNPLMAGSGMG